MFKRLKKDNKKGFTLVELIVVLVILAILAALLVPALTGYIDKARRKQVVAETRMCVMAAQTLVDEEYAKATSWAGGNLSGGLPATITANTIQALAEVEGTVTALTVDSNGKVTELTYQSVKTCTYDPDGASNSDGDYNVAP